MNAWNFLDNHGALIGWLAFLATILALSALGAAYDLVAAKMRGNEPQETEDSGEDVSYDEDDGIDDDDPRV